MAIRKTGVKQGF